MIDAKINSVLLEFDERQCAQGVAIRMTQSDVDAIFYVLSQLDPHFARAFFDRKLSREFLPLFPVFPGRS
jgi:hypothetical protein